MCKTRITLQCPLNSLHRLAQLWLTFGDLGVVYKKYVDLYSASSRSASNALPLPVSRRWSPQANPTARHQRTLRDHAIRVGVSGDMPVYSPRRKPSTHSSLAGSEWIGLGAWFRAEVVYPSKDVQRLIHCRVQPLESWSFFIHNNDKASRSNDNDNDNDKASRSRRFYAILFTFSRHFILWIFFVAGRRPSQQVGCCFRPPVLTAVQTARVSRSTSLRTTDCICETRYEHAEQIIRNTGRRNLNACKIKPVLWLKLFTVFRAVLY